MPALVIESSETFDYIGLLTRRRWIIVASILLSFLASLIFLYLQVPIYRASAVVLIERERDSPTNYQNPGSIERNRDDYYHTQFKLLQSYSLIERLHSKLNLTKDPEFGDPDGVIKLQKAISVIPVMGTRLVNVGADSQSPEQSRTIANALADLFIEQNLESQLFISQEVLKVLQTDAAGGRKAYEMMPAIVNNKLLQELKSQQVRLETQIGEVSQRYTEKHPAVQSLKSQLAMLRDRIDQETDRAVSSFKTELSGQLKGNNARVVDPARLPRRPVKPNRKMFLFGGSALGVILGILIAFLLEMADQTIRTQEQVEQQLKQAFLAFIPFSTPAKGTTSYADLLAPTQSLSSEAIRNLRTMVDFAQASTARSPVLITSTVQEEGKSHVSTNLSVAYAQLHSRTIIIDGDLRRPSLHRKFRTSNERGLSNFLASGEDARQLEDLLQPTDVKGLSLLPCGPRPPNPSELLNTPKVAAVLDWATKRFDRILVDCPPIFPISDTILWGRHIRHSIFIIRFGQTRTPAVREALRRLEVSGLKNLGVVLNAATATGLAYAPNGYHYYQYYRAYKEEEAAS